MIIIILYYLTLLNKPEPNGNNLLSNAQIKIIYKIINLFSYHFILFI